MRAGKSRGNARAAASDTAPRSPDQPTRNASRQASAGLVSAIRRRGELGRKLDANTHRNRVPIAAAQTRSAIPRNSRVEIELGARRMSGSARPRSTNTRPLRTNWTIFQDVSHSTRLLGESMVPSRRPMTSPAVTTARTPETSSLTARRYARYGISSETRTSTGGSSSQRTISAVTRPTRKPTMTPPIDATTKLPIASVSTNVPKIVAVRAAR